MSRAIIAKHICLLSRHNTSLILCRAVTPEAAGAPAQLRGALANYFPIIRDPVQAALFRFV